MSNRSTNHTEPVSSPMSDEVLLSTHEKILGKQPDEKGRYSRLPLGLLFFFSGLIFFGGTYLGRYSGYFHPQIYNENAPVPKVGQLIVAPPADPMVVGKAAYGAV